MEKMAEKMAEIFKTLEDAEILAEREYRDIDAQYREIVEEREEAYQRWQKAKRAFNLIDALQELIEDEAETSE